MRRPIRHIVAVMILGYSLLFVQLNRIQVLDREDLVDNQVNTRTLQRAINKPRGDIYTRDGVLVATSVVDSGSDFFDFQRTYPEGELYAHSVGYMSFTYGADGVERTYNDQLIGESSEQQLTELLRVFEQTESHGDVILTLDHNLQSVARDSLGERQGSVVAIDPVTGEVLALWSYPSFDPGLLARNDGEAVQQAWTELNEAEGQPLRPQAYRDIFFPGSTFKVITAAGALEQGVATLTEPEYPVVESYLPPLTTQAISNFRSNACGGNLQTLLVRSCNAGFAQIGAEDIGPVGMVTFAERFGFNSVPPIDLPAVEPSVFPGVDAFGSIVSSPTAEVPAGIYENSAALAQASIGQNDVKATPLQMVLVAAAVANGGSMPKPYIVAEVRDHADQSLVAQSEPGEWRSAMSPESAAALREAMFAVTNEGTGENTAIGGVAIGSKTGTAELGGGTDRAHAWTIAFMMDGERPVLAVAVLIEGIEGTEGQTGGGEAAPVVRDIFTAFLAANQS